MTNLYHILYNYPALDAESTSIEQEKLATELVSSGRIRIDANDKSNFTRFLIPHQSVNITFSERELQDPKILVRTKNILKKILSKDIKNMKIEEKIELEIKNMLKIINKYSKIGEELELKIARVIVQSAHPIVIKWILLEEVDIFISYGYSIGDVMDVANWKVSGNNNGMQSTDGRDVAIYVSCAGDPFAETQENAIYGDGFPALARMIVIASQEIGHYSDILRDDSGRQISRHSADFSGTKAKENVRIARLKDIQTVNNIKQNLNNFGIESLYEQERFIKFYKKHKINGLRLIFRIIYCQILRYFFVNKLKKIYPVLANQKNVKYIASQLKALLEDMLFNLTPIADAYKRENKVAEEAIACIEAIARVPQQANKWGHAITKIMMKELHNIYYSQIIPSCIDIYQKVTKTKYINSYTKKFYFKYWLKNLFKKQPKRFSVWEVD